MKRITKGPLVNPLILSFCLLLVFSTILGCDDDGDGGSPTEPTNTVTEEDLQGQWVLRLVVKERNVDNQPAIRTAPPYQAVLDFSGEGSLEWWMEWTDPPDTLPEEYPLAAENTDEVEILDNRLHVEGRSEAYPFYNIASHGMELKGDSLFVSPAFMLPPVVTMLTISQEIYVRFGD